MSKRAKKSHKNNRFNHTAELKKLYDIAFRILELRPWKHFNSGDFFIQHPKDGSEMILACTINTLADGFGVLIYPKQAFCPDSVLFPEAAAMSERDYIESEYYALFFDTWSELPDESQTMLKSIGVLPSVSSLYPWFSHKTFGCPNADILPQDYAILSDILGNLVMQYRSILEEHLLVDFDAGQALVRMYSPKDKLWYNMAAKMDFAPKTPIPIHMREDSLKLAALRKCPESTELSRVEFDFGWDSEPVLDGENGDPYYPMCVLFADRITGKKLTYYTCHPMDLMDAAFTAWAELIQQYGKPQTLYLSRPESVGLFQDFADKLSVRVKVVKRLPAVQRLFRENGII